MVSLKNCSDRATTAKSEKLWPRVKEINDLEAGLQKLSDDELRAKTAAWKDELSKISDKDELAQKLNEILPEAFAVVKNACRRLCGAGQSSCANIR